MWVFSQTWLRWTWGQRPFFKVFCCLIRLRSRLTLVLFQVWFISSAWIEFRSITILRKIMSVPLSQYPHNPFCTLLSLSHTHTHTTHPTHAHPPSHPNAFTSQCSPPSGSFTYPLSVHWLLPLPLSLPLPSSISLSLSLSITYPPPDKLCLLWQL